MFSPSSTVLESWKVRTPALTMLFFIGHQHQWGGSGAVLSHVALKWCPLRTQVSGGRHLDPCEPSDTM